MTCQGPATADTLGPLAGPAPSRGGRRRRMAVPAVGASRFSAGPVRELIEQRMRLCDVSLPELAATLGVPLRTLHRVLHAPVLGWMVADRCAVALGYHPCQLWPDWFPQPQATADLDEDLLAG